jgi:hypothetical protein
MKCRLWTNEKLSIWLWHLPFSDMAPPMHPGQRAIEMRWLDGSLTMQTGQHNMEHTHTTTLMLCNR